MPIRTIEAFYLGVFADLDPDENNFRTENAGSLVGTTFGGVEAPLYDSIDSLGVDDADSDGTVRENDNGQTGEDLIYNGQNATLDSVTDYFVTLTYSDGTTANTRMEILQDVSGRLFLVPFREGNSSNNVLDDKPIRSVELAGIVGDNFDGFFANPESDAFIDGVVQGTSGNDAMGTSYTDADGTQMNAYGGNDTVDAGAGNDTVNAGGGDDVVAGGTGADSIEGGEGADQISGGDGDDIITDSSTTSSDTIDGGAGNDSISAGGGNDLIDGGAGADTIDGGGGQDVIYGGTGADSIQGGGGNDLIYGGDDTATSVGGSNTAGDTYTVIHLGRKGEVDDAEGNNANENANVLLGSYGGAGSELYNSFQSAFVSDDNANTQIDFNDQPAPEHITINGKDKFVDTGIVYNATVIFTDGTSGNFTAVVIQTTDGDVYMMPEVSNNADNALLTSKPIQSISLNSVNTGYTNVTANRLDADYKLPGDADTSGDTIDGGAGADTIYGGAGDDTLTGGGGTDSVMGGSGDDLFRVDGNDGTGDVLAGGTGSDTLDFVDTEGVTGAQVTFTGNNAGTYNYSSSNGSFTGMDGIDGTSFNDSVDASADSNGGRFDMGAGDDTVVGGSGDDTILGGDGDDSLSGGFGNDSIEGGAGNDTIEGGATPNVTPTSEFLNWSAQGADESDLSGGFTQDTGVMDVSVSYVDQGAGDEFTVESSDTQYVASGEPFNPNSAAVLGGDGNGPYSTTTIDFNANTAGYANEVENVQFRLNDIDSDSWTDRVTINAFDADGNLVPVTLTQSGNGDDSISGNQITGANGSDTPENESGSALVNILGPVARIEILYENLGTNVAVINVTDVHFETMSGGGADRLTGGDGDDVFVYTDGHDTITDFNTGNTGLLEDGDSTNNDFINLADYYDTIFELHADQADDGILNQSNTTDTEGQSVDYSDNTQFGPEGSLTFSGASADRSSFTRENTGVVCFTSGTAIRTPRGDVLIEELRLGDLVCTLDNGPQPIRWIGRRVLKNQELQDNPNLRPVLIHRNVLGAERELLVSPQHGMLIGRSGDHLARAKHLAMSIPGVRIAHGKRRVTYVHLMFDAHQILLAENVPAESFYPGPMALQMLDRDARNEMQVLFPGLFTNGAFKGVPADVYGYTARDFITRKRVTALTSGDLRPAALASL